MSPRPAVSPESRRASPRPRRGARGAASGLAAALAAIASLACDGGAGQSDPAGACAVRLTSVALYQAVKIPLADEANDNPPRSADVVVGREALVRAFVAPVSEGAHEVEAQLSLAGATGTRVYADRKTLRTTSQEASLASTFTFRVAASDLTEATTWSVALVAPSACSRVAFSTRLPSTGPAPLRARATGTLQITLVPVRYDADGSGRMPDLSPAQLEQYRRQLVSLYPVAGVDLTVRESIATSSVIDDDGWVDLLDRLRALRAQDRPPPEVYYFGLVAPAATFASYCSDTCTAGIAYQSDGRSPELRVGVGIGFSGPRPAQTLAHEIGHEHGLSHSPCGARSGVDPAFPHAGGGIGVWGWDVDSNRLLNPTIYSDFMGYCSNTWISDYSYQRILERSVAINGAHARQALTTAVEGRALLVDGRGRARWGQTAALAAGTPERAHALDVEGRVVAEIEVRRTAIGDSAQAMVVVPPPQAGWESLVVAGVKAPIPLAELSARPVPGAAPLFGRPRHSTTAQP